MKRIAAVLVILTMVLLPPMPVQAESPSDAVITMQDTITFRNLATSGDMLILSHIRWTSGNTSATPASSAVSVRLIADNGTTLVSKAPYVFSLFDNNGYGDFIVSFYLSSNTTWGEESQVQVVGLPAYFDPLPLPLYYDIPASDYTSALTQEDNREEMTTWVLNLTDILRTVYPDVELKSTTDGGGSVLSSYGETYFMAVIDGLMNLCPDLFYVQTYIPEEIAVQAYDMSTADTYTGRLVDSDIHAGMVRIGSYIGVSGYVVWGILTFVACIAVIIACFKKGWDLPVGLAIDVLIVTGMAILVGELLFTMIMIIGLVSIMGIAFALLGKRA